MDRSDGQPRGLHNVVTLQVVRHVWSGIHVHDIRMKALPGRSWHPLNSDRPVLSIVVSELRGQCEARLDLNAASTRRPSGRQRPIGHVSLIPAGVPVWGYSDGIDQVEEVRLLLDVARMKEIMGEEFTSAPLLSKVMGFIRDNLARPIRLSELASLADLSPSQFGRAFKISTRSTPHLWHLNARIESAKRLLADRDTSLAEIALDIGFSEQSHFTRAFHAATGFSPGAWRRHIAS